MRHSADANTAADFSFQVHFNESQSLEEVEHDLLKCLSLKPGGSLSPSCVNKELSACIIFFFQRLSLVCVAEEEEPMHLSKVGCPSAH